MQDKTLLKVDLRKTIDNLSESIEKYTEHQNKIWQGVLRLIITLSSSLLLVTIALVEKIFDSAIPGFLIFSWILFFISIVFGIVAEINEVIFFSNFALSDAKKMKEYENILSEGKEIPYLPEDDIGMIYNDIWWGVIAIDSFIFAVLFMCTALLEKIMSHVSCYSIIIAGTIFIAIVNIYLIRKRNTDIKSV
ncbi:MAG: hypothetical protein H8D56_14615 [Planctomycetes bacterium]|nr:hypothetical protein [Planctomycetota bacterium]MBL7143898.1 hypothetical protein [Phycisphaerae bacterium]